MVVRQYPIVWERLPDLTYKTCTTRLAVRVLASPGVDLRSGCPPIYDQGRLGSCTAQALIATFQFDDPNWRGSALFLYYNERMLDNSVSSDKGSSISTGIRSLTQHGVCSESLWPYDCDKFATLPSAQCYKSALEHQTLSSHHVTQDLTSMKESLLSGEPIVLGFMVYESFESDAVAATGLVPIPTPTEKCLGGHAVVVVGFNESARHWIMRNSWGPSWGDKGYFYMPYEYLTDARLASDLWVITKIEIPEQPVPPKPVPAPPKPVPAPPKPVPPPRPPGPTNPWPIPLPFPPPPPPIPFPFPFPSPADFPPFPFP